MSITADLTPAQKEIATTYNRCTRHDIANYGAHTGAAWNHLSYAETTAFFYKYQNEIEDHMYDTIGEDWLEKLCINKTSITGFMNDVAWQYIDIICNELPSIDYN